MENKTQTQATEEEEIASIDISDSLAKTLYDLCCEIEKLPASEQQTKCSSMASDALLLFSLRKS